MALCLLCCLNFAGLEGETQDAKVKPCAKLSTEGHHTV